MHSLDLLYEKETTSKLMEFKIKYLCSYAALMRNYFIHMNFQEIIQDFQQKDDHRGYMILVIVCMIVAPHLRFPLDPDQITSEHI